MFRSVSEVVSDMMGCCVVSSELSFPSVHLCSHLLWFRRWSQTTAGQYLERWAAGMSTLNVQPALLPSSAKLNPKTTCLPGALQIWSQDGVIMFLLILHICPPSHLFHSKIESRMQRRPRSTSMKDRQNSKAQSDRTSSMESECSPDSRLIAQVMCYPVFFLFFFKF